MRRFLHLLQDSNNLIQISKPVDRNLQAASILHELEPHPVRINSVKGFNVPVAGNLYCTKSNIASFFGLESTQLIPFLLQAMEHPRPCPVVTQAPCQEVIIDRPNLDQFPILFYCEKDGGNYISSGLVIAKHPTFGQNLDYHRLMQYSQDEMAVRVVKKRHFDQYLHEMGQVDIAVCIGNPPNLMLAAGISVGIGRDELEIANAMAPVPLVHAHSVDLMIPAECEIVLEGTVYQNRRHSEGPFLDLTETYDIVRDEPIFKVKTITHRKDPIWQALLPGGLEHKMLMGTPREPTIYQKVNEVTHCLDVNITPGGCSWLHAIVKIDKQTDEDGKKAIMAAFAGHSSLKHVAIVDDDIDIYNPAEVEWTMATRFQADRDLVILPGQHGSSLDPSAEPDTQLTTKVGFDLTKPFYSTGKSFSHATYTDIDISAFINDQKGSK
jgi:UbiD family decarboxylase